MKTIPLLLLAAMMGWMACKNVQKKHAPSSAIIGKGDVPDLAIDKAHMIHLVYGSGDSILYSISTDRGLTFSDPLVVDTMSGLFSFAMRGPQIAVNDQGVCILACDQSGNIFSYRKSGSGIWARSGRVNDVDTIAKEGFCDMGGDGKNQLFAVWLDLRNNRHNNIYGARSIDGGQTWSKNT